MGPVTCLTVNHFSLLAMCINNWPDFAIILRNERMGEDWEAVVVEEKWNNGSLALGSWESI